MRVRRGDSLWLALVVAGACGRGAPGIEPSPASAPDTAALGRDIPDMLRVSGVPGLSIAVVRDGRVVWTGAFGTANDSTVFEAASLSKPVFAWLVLRLAGRGEIDLERPLLEILDYPRLAADHRARRITARTVLTHSTGLPNWGGDTLGLAFDPGTDYGYSGEAFTLLQKAVERVMGASLDELARREVFGPLGMTRSGFVWQERFAGHEAWARSWRWHVAPVNRYADANAAYSLVTTAEDYGRFVAAVLTGRGLPPETWKAFLSPARETSPGIHIGLGIRLEDGPAGRRFYHSGSNGRRFTCYMAGDLATGTGLAFFTSAYDGTSLVRPIASRVMGESPAARHWEWYDRHDDPRRLAMKSVQRAAVDGGAEAFRDRLREAQADSATRLSLDQILEVGAFLAARGLTALSIEVLEDAVAGAPDSADAHLELGRSLESAGRLEAAIESYRRAAALEAVAGEAGEHVRWAEERRWARASSPDISQRELESFVGDYRERTVSLRQGRLYFSGGADPESALVPLSSFLFELEADPAVRVRFEGDGLGPPKALVAIYRDGTVDRWERRQ